MSILEKIDNFTSSIKNRIREQTKSNWSKFKTWWSTATNKQRGIFIVIAAVLCLFLFSFITNSIESSDPSNSAGESQTPATVRNPTKTEVIAEITTDFRECLQKKPNPFFQAVEQAHGTVTATGGSVRRISVETIDGGDFVGVNGENIGLITIVLRITWDGIIHKNGYTDISADYDCHTQQVSNAKIVETNALISPQNIESFLQGFIGGLFML